jgi:hypothetical protein
MCGSAPHWLAQRFRNFQHLKSVLCELLAEVTIQENNYIEHVKVYISARSLSEALQIRLPHGNGLQFFRHTT